MHVVLPSVYNIFTILSSFHKTHTMRTVPPRSMPAELLVPYTFGVVKALWRLACQVRGGVHGHAAVIKKPRISHQLGLIMQFWRQLWLSLLSSGFAKTMAAPAKAVNV